MSRTNARRFFAAVMSLFVCAPAMAHSIVTTGGRAVVHPDRVDVVTSITTAQLEHVYAEFEDDLASAARAHLDVLATSLQVYDAAGNRVALSAKDMTFAKDDKDGEAEFTLTYPLASPPRALTFELVPSGAIGMHRWQMALAIKGDASDATTTLRLPNAGNLGLVYFAANADGVRVVRRPTLDDDLCAVDPVALPLLGHEGPVVSIAETDDEIVVDLVMPAHQLRFAGVIPTADPQRLTPAEQTSFLAMVAPALSQAISMSVAIEGAPEPRPLSLHRLESAMLDVLDDGIAAALASDAPVRFSTARVAVRLRFKRPPGAKQAQARWTLFATGVFGAHARIAAADGCIAHCFAQDRAAVTWTLQPQVQ